MGSFLKHIVQFAGFALVFYIVAVMLWSNWGTPEMMRNVPYPISKQPFLQQRIDEAAATKNVDILFLGSSHAYRSFDPRFYAKNNLKTFNLGSSSQTPIQTKMLLDQYLDSLNPKLVVFEVYPVVFQLDGLESALDFVANTKFHWRTAAMTSRVNHIKLYNALIYDVVRESTGQNDSIGPPSPTNKDTYVPGGFVETGITHNERPLTAQQRIDFFHASRTIKRKQWNAFIDIIDELIARDIPYLLMQTPVTSEVAGLNSRMPMGWQSSLDVDSLFEAQGPYLNFNDRMELDDSLDFKDYHHLNQRGVERLNAELLDVLIQTHDHVARKVTRKGLREP